MGRRGASGSLPTGVFMDEKTGKTLWGRSIAVTLVTTIMCSMALFPGCRMSSFHTDFPIVNNLAINNPAVEGTSGNQSEHVTAAQTASAQGPVAGLFQNFGRNTVEADPDKGYPLTEMEGPYLIFAAAFSGPTARQDAHALVLELRRTYKWNAYIYEKVFDFDVAKDFRNTRNPQTGMRQRYMNHDRETEFAVLIGNFPSLEDRRFERTLDEVRKSQPETIKHRRSALPISMAYGLANPMLPAEHQRGGVDAFIVSLNKDRPYTLLRNPRRYTVQIATFTGHTEYTQSSSLSSVMDRLSAANPKKMTDLEKGEQAAAKLCKALRERGIEAYEFHERHGSIVTVGSFDQYEQRLSNGAARYHPMIQQIIEQYQGQVTGNSYNPVIIDGVECDLIPRVIEVPRPRQ